MRYEEISIGQKVSVCSNNYYANATVAGKNSVYKLIKLEFDVVNGKKSGTDGWWNPSLLMQIKK